MAGRVFPIRLAYLGNMVHFASARPEMLYTYNPVRRESQQIYPQKNDPLRADFSARLRKVIDKRRCEENNWTCDPNEFETDIRSVEVNDTTGALAFHVSFDTAGFLTRPEAEDSGQWFDDDYVYIYQLNPLRWRAYSIYDLKPEFRTDSLKELLTPGKLMRVFSKSSF